MNSKNNKRHCKSAAALRRISNEGHHFMDICVWFGTIVTAYIYYLSSDFGN